ncbi:UDP-3-O-[3-hydroxymyristoyl] glucosamine N-acyltransferase [Nitrosococcus oceani ATCC 19707]|uniref:UDP-3-O-acylglucosamine N-acyltransferase n=2 Tax=Nitrosococcus oceani TaxID=1229 RepID=LPXD_NITOC|nr:UDP-3-O-(3-hydroxymyristoyl)glucosamine N-acyltransferase [Nitrosococcus oceani]Q3JEI7.1 RecName: Full=UDP-3-O-acylglucosamine N-acyltransferase [Nitrosococcus oceani ATCC 19707]KFI20713.1 UDP-3-O-(3-hydroxymyristoyl) glucosamine N-acyltransferase [Nitrosococcus oceani C-27]ABA56759.1 UDP-3-O-[3-hydroxymyristoyl] glucosamine N-acyltransferase [Nitrosococcus oceani ATCC 19707]EDZ66538.1 UDP-3-O-(3-hydroxymyristoyl) glucosamine N-acyltransferase [Nitrosococcus oceani AFC27]GEM20516.1 UDP-3-O-
MEIRLSEIAQFLGCAIEGDGEAPIRGIAPLHQAQASELSFYTNRKYAAQARLSKAGAIIVGAKDREQFAGRRLLISDNPYRDFARVVDRWFNRSYRPAPGVHPTAIVGDDVQIAENCSIGAYCVIEDGVTIKAHTVLFPFCYVGAKTILGEHCLLYPRVTLLERVRIGHRVILHPGVVIGGDGFGFAPDPPQGYFKVPQVGWVEIADDVEVQCNTAIDRGALGPTRIGQGSKIDNLVQVGHNVEIGEHSIIVSQVGISGSSKIGNWVTLAGQVGLVGHIRIGDGAVITAQSGVAKDVPPKAIMTGSPVQPMMENRRALAELNRLRELRKKVRELERRLTVLEQVESC